MNAKLMKKRPIFKLLILVVTLFSLSSALYAWFIYESGPVQGTASMGRVELATNQTTFQATDLLPGTAPINLANFDPDGEGGNAAGDYRFYARNSGTVTVLLRARITETFDLDPVYAADENPDNIGPADDRKFDFVVWNDPLDDGRAVIEDPQNSAASWVFYEGYWYYSAPLAPAELAGLVNSIGLAGSTPAIYNGASYSLHVTFQALQYDGVVSDTDTLVEPWSIDGSYNAEFSTADGWTFHQA